MSQVIGLLPAAGRGVRAYPHTATIPKSMLEVDGKPNLQRNVELMRDQLGITEVRIVVGYQGEVIRRHFGDGSAFGVRITYVENPRVDLELPYSIHLGTRGLDRTCCVILSDECYVDSNHAALLRDADPEAAVVCGVIVGESAKQIRKNYAVTLREGRIVDLIEKPRTITGPLMGTGTYLLRPEALRRLTAAYEGAPEAGPRDWTSWIATLARSGVRVAPFRLAGRYVNINSRDDLNTANYLVRDFRFDQRRVSFVFVVDGDETAAARGVARFAAEPGLDELVIAAPRRIPALEGQCSQRVRLVVPDDPALPIGALVRLGLDAATGDILLIANSDDTFAPRDVGKLLVYLRDADLVVGTRTTRQMLEQGSNMRGIVRLAHVVLAKLLQLLWWRFECRFTDIGCVYRGLWRSTYATIRDHLTAPGIEVFVEMVIEVMRARRRIIEIPVHYYNRDLEHARVHTRYQTAAVFARALLLVVRRRWADAAPSLRWRRPAARPESRPPGRASVPRDAQGVDTSASAG